jgi:hypothetical protein
MIQIAMFLLGVLVALAVAGIYVSRRYTLRPKSLKTPFGEFDISRFDELSHVQLFENVSVVLINPSIEALETARDSSSQITPLALVHAGWTLVCDTFVERFKAYPTDEAVRNEIQALGAQNADFIITYRKIYESALSYADALTREFATAYFSRAPALSQRIAAGERISPSSAFEALSLTIRRETLTARVTPP